MRKLSVIIFFAIFTITSACHKDSKVIPQDFYFNGTKNNSPWGATASVIKISSDSLRISAFNKAGDEQLDMDIKFTGNGTYPLGLGQIRYLTNLSLSTPTNEYYADTLNKSQLIISSYDAKNGIISGTGTIRMLKNTVDYTQLVFGVSKFRAKLP